MTSDEQVAEFETALEDAEGMPCAAGGPGAGETPGQSFPPEGEVTPEKVVAALEVAIAGGFALVCGINRVPFDDQARFIASFTDKERATLTPYAAYTLPYIPKVVKYADLCGALYFTFLFASTTKQKMDALKNHIQGVKVQEEAEQAARRDYEDVMGAPGAPNGPERDNSGE